MYEARDALSMCVYLLKLTAGFLYWCESGISEPKHPRTLNNVPTNEEVGISGHYFLPDSFCSATVPYEASGSQDFSSQIGTFINLKLMTLDLAFSS